ncbi:MAG: Uma2 family endonuclease [Chloroflexota bacterium]|nr:Uma2 family endonuclease [Chloroflexota bacterium]
MIDPTRTYTVDDLYELARLPEYADMRLELSEGRLITMSPASIKHGKHANWLGYLITRHVDEHDLGEVAAAETGYILYKNPDPKGKDIVRAPDVSFIATARIPIEGLPESGYFNGAPDLAVEVVSPGDDAAEIQTKIEEYLRYGVRMIVIAYPKPRTIVVHTTAGIKTLKGDEVLDGGAVLPGFAVTVNQIFK